MTLQFIKEIPDDMFTGLNKIATGSFSDFFSAIHVKTNTEVALKVVLTQNKEETSLISQEIAINKTLNHPFICRFFSEFNTDHLKILSMELIDGTSLLDYLNKKGKLSIPEAQSIFAQILILIEYLHDEAHIIHRDLKLENIMIDKYNHIRLIDFGFMAENSNISSKYNSVPYCAPEVLMEQKYTNQSDIWSMGVILYALVHGKLPFFNEDTKTLIQLIVNSKVVFPLDFNEHLCDLLTKMFDKDPAKRIQLEEIKMHPFIKNEKILNIEYKRLFSPTHAEPDSINQLKCYKHDANIKMNANIVSPIFRKSQCKSLYTPAIYKPKNNLHEKVTLKTDDVNLTIKSRKNFSDSLNRLIQSAFDPNSKYYLAQFKFRKGKISMAKSCVRMIGNKNNRQIPSNSFQPKAIEKEKVDSPLEQLLLTNKNSQPIQAQKDDEDKEAQKKQLFSSANSLSSQPLQNQPSLGDKEAQKKQLFSSANSLSSQPLQNQMNFGDKEEASDLEDSPLTQLLNSSDSLSTSHFQLSLNETVEDSPMKRLLNSTDSLSSGHFQSQLRLNEAAEDSPMKKLLHSCESLTSKPFRRRLRPTRNVEDGNDLPKSSFIAPTNSFSSLLLKNQAATGSHNDFSISSSSSLAKVNPSGSQNSFAFKRITAPMMALNRKPSIQNFKLNDIKSDA